LIGAVGGDVVGSEDGAFCNVDTEVDVPAGHKCAVLSPGQYAPQVQAQQPQHDDDHAYPFGQGVAGYVCGATLSCSRYTWLLSESATYSAYPSGSIEMPQGLLKVGTRLEIMPDVDTWRTALLP
jgi:hypothetical protein